MFQTLRFCKVLKGTKKPFEKDWTVKPYTWEEIQDHISRETNYGVLCGYGDLAVIDADTPELQEQIEKTLPLTFRVRTGSGGMHSYFIVPELKEKIVLTTGIGEVQKHWGEVQSYGSQVIGAGSIHPNGKIYEIISKVPIQLISLQQLLSSIAPFRREIQQSASAAREETRVYGDALDSLRVKTIWGTAGLQYRNGEYYGAHPIHGSDGGMNFWINDAKNMWHCFRCNSGGGALSAIAVKEGIISCADAQKGALRGEKAWEAILLAKKHYSLPESVRIDLNRIPAQVSDASKPLSIWKYMDFENLQKETDFIVQDVVYPKTVTMVYSPPGEFKSIIALLMGMAVAQGQEWLHFATKKYPVLYCDKENNDQILKNRLMGLFKGENYDEKDFPFYVLRRNGDLLDPSFVKKMRDVIKEKKIKLVFFDTLHRFADYDENKSDDINRLYTFVFQPLIEDFDCSIIFLHHTKKDGGYRGSGDFLGMVDTAYAVFRERSVNGSKSNKFRIVNEKCRAGEIDTILGEIDFGEDYIKVLRLNYEVETENKISKVKELTLKVRSTIRAGEILTRKDIADRFEIEGFDFSLATLKRSLKYLLDNHYIRQNEKGAYLLF